MIKSKGENEPSNSSILKFKPPDLIDFMVRRAKVEPLAFCFLIEIRFAECIFLLHQAEKQSRNDLFLASIKFLLPLYASSHAIKYVSMLSDFLIDWFCMSDAEKIIFARGVITRKTKNGRNIFTDRFVEWMMKDMRMWLGKHASMHHHKLVEQVAVTLNERKKKKCLGSKSKKKVDTGQSSSPVKELEINKVFCESLLFAYETNLWGPGDIVFDEKKKASCHEETNSDNWRSNQRPFKSVKGVPLNTDLLFCVSTGTMRASKYFETFLVDGNLNDPKRPEKESEGGVSLKKVETKVAEDEKDFHLEMERVCLLDMLQINDAYTVNEMKQEMKYLNAQLKKVGKKEVKRDTHVYKTPSKASFASCVAKARLELLDMDNDFVEKRKVDIFEKHDMKRMAKEREFSKKVDAELQNSFFCLKGVKEYEEMKNNESSFSFSFRSKEIFENRAASIVMSDESDCEDNNRRKGSNNIDKTRESVGGTKLFAAGGLF